MRCKCFYKNIRNWPLVIYRSLKSDYNAEFRTMIKLLIADFISDIESVVEYVFSKTIFNEAIIN